MFNLNTLVRVIRTLVMVLVFAEAAMAQSTLNFVHGFEGPGKTITIANTSSNSADVRFTFYKTDPSLSSNLPYNPVSYRIPPKGRISMTAADIFGGVPPAGWIQATSAISGLSAQSSEALSDQVISFLDPYPGTEIQVTNNGTLSATGSVTFYDPQGNAVTDNGIISLDPHNQATIPIPVGSASVHVSGTPLVVTSLISVEGRSILLSGQPATPRADTRVVPLFKSGNNDDSTLSLTNPASDLIHLAITYVDDSNVESPTSRFEIPGNGSVSLNFGQLSGDGGYLRIDSDNSPLAGFPLAGLLVAKFDGGAVAIPMESNPSDRLLFNDPSNGSALHLINAFTDQTTVEVTYSSSDGATVAQTSYAVGHSRILLISDFVLPSADLVGGFVSIRSMNGAKLFGVEIDLQAGVAIGPKTPVSTYVASPVYYTPGVPTALVREVAGGSDFHAGDMLVGQISDVLSTLPFSVSCAGKTAETAFLIQDPESGNLRVRFSIPPVEPGFVNCKVRSGGLESNTFKIRVLDAASTLTDQLDGQAFYQKIELTDNGLDIDHPLSKPIRNGRVEVFDAVTRKVISVSDTDSNGKFIVAVPPDATNLSIQAVSRLRSLDLKVEDNTNSNQYYFIPSADVDMRERPAAVPIVDKTRASGAFNILEQIQRANDFVHTADPTFVPFGFTIFWSDKNQNKNPLQPGFIPTTSFNLATGTANILGDRSADSDEYDDSVLIHEYAHMLAAKLSRDDSPGGQHHIGDLLDPRVAWSEGFANFFSGAVRGDSIYRDSNGSNGVNVLRFDLEENFPALSKQGYGSETSVQALLWDLVDDKSELGDTAQFDFSQVWDAIKDLKNQHFVYLPYFLDNLLARNPLASDSIQRMVQAQSIDFQPGVIPSVSNPFPGFIAMNSTRTGQEVDSLTTKRMNLAQSAHFFVFSTVGGLTSIRLDIVQPAINPKANDLDLFLFDLNGKLISKSDAGQSGKGEMIPIVLPAGSYVIEVRSYYTNDKGVTVFNSGKYNLSLLGQ